LQEAAEGKCHAYFVDAAHFVWGSFLSVLWCFARQFIRSATGRSRYNVLGALNAVTNHMVTITNTGYINSWCVVDLLKELRRMHLDEPITIILDNARYQRCYLVERAAYMYDIELLFLPPYSPNLNLIERVWKFIKKKALNNRSFDSFVNFQNSINQCIDGFTTCHKEELKSLLTFNFQLF
jgi:transposase|tara:strand:+ start:268 stop:810 length:543 start_codon:yes stop_codon:yes gene_type:complete